MTNTKGLEIEKKYFLNPGWEKLTVGKQRIEQYYLVDTNTQGIVFPFVSRIRIIDNIKALFTCKIDTYGRDVRFEIENEIDLDLAKHIVGIVSPPSLVKTRHFVPLLGDDLTLEVDVFEDYNAGLVVGEIEFKSEEDSKNPISYSFLGNEIVSSSMLYKRLVNSNLVKDPFSQWTQERKDNFFNQRLSSLSVWR